MVACSPKKIHSQVHIILLLQPSSHLAFALILLANSLAMAEMGGAKAASLALRIVALALSVAAAVVMGSVVSYNSALVYFVVGSVVSAVCSALALYLFVVHGDRKSVV